MDFFTETSKQEHLPNAVNVNQRNVMISKMTSATFVYVMGIIAYVSSGCICWPFTQHDLDVMACVSGTP